MGVVKKRKDLSFQKEDQVLENKQTGYLFDKPQM
jgi:hypothetical protein